MSRSFQELVQFIKTGEPVAPGTDNRVTRALDANIRFLRDLLEAAEIGETVFARDVTIEAEAVVGMPVYWDGSGQISGAFCSSGSLSWTSAPRLMATSMTESTTCPGLHPAVWSNNARPSRCPCSSPTGRATSWSTHRSRTSFTTTFTTNSTWSPCPLGTTRPRRRAVSM